MFHILVVIAFVPLAVKFFSLAQNTAWNAAKIIASFFFAISIPAMLISVVIQNIAFILLPLAFVLTAIELLDVCEQKACRAEI